MKKLTVMLLVFTMLCTIFVFDTSAESNDNNIKSVKDAIAEYEAQTGEKVETNRYYFLMPDGTNGEKGDDDTRDYEGFRYSIYYDEYAPSWYNEYTIGSAGIYWWDSDVADPEKWPGYTMEKGDSDSVFYADVPIAVHTLKFNNYVDCGMDSELNMFYVTDQSVNIPCEYYDPDESPTYPDGLDSFDNMIYVLDPDLYSNFEWHGIPTWGGEWYYYYGDGCYGTEMNGNKTDCIRDDHCDDKGNHIAVELIVGDVDGDGDVSIMDATEIQMMIANIKPMVDSVTVADSDCDGTVTIMDATAIQLKLAQIE